MPQKESTKSINNDNQTLNGSQNIDNLTNFDTDPNNTKNNGSDEEIAGTKENDNYNDNDNDNNNYNADDV